MSQIPNARPPVAELGFANLDLDRARGDGIVASSGSPCKRGVRRSKQEKAPTAVAFGAFGGIGRYWTRTSDPYRVRIVL